ncbi:Uncharacterised protein [Vibrio cholerae]|uniref:Uncharacterized protein n=1 Tax=Vibrio cholerae TaxID=666 RepID=A0A655VCE8_VIBCL|nr:Uncharacterised protein [Vibrio cholerae]CRZ78079.1 Uncharacterised protein [Vibrio cholerae]CRZ84128.1 Uncharacterised protein [Vibrio cholerae]CSA04064.1 Uncharacterised protein [Vibrio cholerae]CSA06170.1 Uncharacterised protein [Vibrio cholerae]
METLEIPSTILSICREIRSIFAISFRFSVAALVDSVMAKIISSTVVLFSSIPVNIFSQAFRLLSARSLPRRAPCSICVKLVIPVSTDLAICCAPELIWLSAPIISFDERLISSMPAESSSAAAATSSDDLTISVDVRSSSVNSSSD